MTTAAIDQSRLEAFMGQAVVDLAASFSAPLVRLGARLGLYRGLAEGGPATPDELAERTGTEPRMVREWRALLDVLDADRLVWVTSSTEANDRIKAEPFYKKLKVSQDKRDLFVPYEDPDIGAAFSFYPTKILGAYGDGTTQHHLFQRWLPRQDSGCSLADDRRHQVPLRILATDGWRAYRPLPPLLPVRLG